MSKLDNLKRQQNLILVLLFVFSNSFAQEIVSEEIELWNDSVAIPGTLSYPETTKKIPLMIFVHGSGNVDRYGNQSGTFVQANYIKTLAG